MSEELRTEPNAYFMTLTISDESYEILKNTYKSEDDNTIVFLIGFVSVITNMAMGLPLVMIRSIKPITSLRMSFFMRMRTLTWLIGILFAIIMLIRNGQSIRLLGPLPGVLVTLDRSTSFLS